MIDLSQIDDKLKVSFLEKGLPNYSQTVSVASGFIRDYFSGQEMTSEYYRNNINPEEQVVYALNALNPTFDRNYIIILTPPYKKDGKFIDGVLSCVACVIEKTDISTNEQGMSSAKIDFKNIENFPIPKDAINPNWLELHKEVMVPSSIGKNEDKSMGR